MIILTHGGPGLATHVLSLLAFNDAYTGFDFGAAAAVATVMLVVADGVHLGLRARLGRDAD